MFNLEVDLSELRNRGDKESKELKERLDKIASSNPDAKQLIDGAISDYTFTPFEEHVELDPSSGQNVGGYPAKRSRAAGF